MQINISKYIFQYLKTNGAIYLNGIGKIEQFRKPALINDAGIEIIPPQSFFRFENDSKQDLTFISWLSQKTFLNENICETSLQTYIERILDKLETGNSFHIPLVGTISLQDGIIDFQSDVWSLYYKYPALVLSPIPVQKVIAEEPKSTRSRMWLIPLFLAMLAVSFIGWKSYQSYQSKLTINEKNHDPVKQGRINQAPIFDSMLTKDSIMESQLESNNEEKTKQEIIIPVDSVETSANQIAEEENANQETAIIPNESQLNEENISLGFEDDCIVIVGAFRQSSNVDKMMKRLSDDGFSPWKSNHNGLVRVGAKTTCDPGDLNTLLSNCKSKYDSGAWVLE